MIGFSGYRLQELGLGNIFALKKTKKEYTPNTV